MQFTILPSIILSIISVIIATTLIVMIYNVFFAADATTQDAETLMKTINAMLASSKPFEQQTIYLRLEDNYFVGYDETDDNEITVYIDRRFLTEGLGRDEHWVFTKPSSCAGKACLCVFDKEAILNKCREFIVPENKHVNLVADYSGYVVEITPKRNPVPLPAELSATSLANVERKSFVAGTKLVKFSQATTGTATTGGQRATKTYAILPVIIEKQIRDNTIQITLLPVTTYAASRSFYFERCPDGNSCSGLTGFSSQQNQGAKITYCSVSILDGTCSLEAADQCRDGKQIAAPCICGSSLALSGFCARGVNYDLECDVVRECEDYCLRDDRAVGSTADPDSDCVAAEQVFCTENPCELQDDEHHSCRVENNKCVS